MARHLNDCKYPAVSRSHMLRSLIKRDSLWLGSCPAVNISTKIFSSVAINKAGKQPDIKFWGIQWFHPYRCWHRCCVSIQGLHPSKDLVFVVFEGESFRETLLTSSAVVKCDGLAFGAFPGCVTRCFTLTSWFLPPRPAKVTICATRCHHFLSFFILFWAYK